MKYRCPFWVAVGNDPDISVWINCNNFVFREDPFPVVRVFLPFIQLTHFFNIPNIKWLEKSFYDYMINSLL